jgi:hypothetical protein
MRRRGSGLFQRAGKCAGKSRRINWIRLELVFRRAQQKCAQNPNKISALASELVFREVPGKSVQRRWRADRFGGLTLVALRDSMGGRVTGVAGAPTGLRLLAAGSLAVRFTASALAVADSHVWPEPPSADPARSLPGIGHARSSSPPPDGQLLASIGGSVLASAEARPVDGVNELLLLGRRLPSRPLQPDGEEPASLGHTADDVGNAAGMRSDVRAVGLP